MILYNNIYANLDELLTGRPLKIAQNHSKCVRSLIENFFNKFLNVRIFVTITPLKLRDYNTLKD